MIVDYTAPAGLLTRGTVLIVAGRGETPATYERLGRRLSADAYLVRVIDPSSALSTALDGLDVVRPLVLLGADTGAAAVTALAAGDSVWRPDAVIAAGLPGYGDGPGGDWEDELDVRTSCPTHRGVLTADPSVSRGALAAPVDRSLLDEAYGTTSEIPHLLLIGSDDPLADTDALDRTAKALATARLAVVAGAHHDVLNDLQHRSVAATIVLFLEALRGGSPLEPAVR